MNDKQSASSGTGSLSRRGMLRAVGATGLGAAVASLAAGCTSGGTSTAAAASSAPKRTGSVYYWISHGAPGDQIWVLALRGARQVGTDLGVTVRTSLLDNNVAAQENAITSAIAAGAAGIATTSPQPHVLGPLVAKAKAAGIPVVTFNVDDPSCGRVAFTGPNSTDVGKLWAQFLVQEKLVKPGDTVFLPVEQAGAAYQVLETSGINSVFQPMHIKAEVFQAGADPAASTTAMQNYLSAHPGVSAMIGLGDQVTSNTENVFKALGWAPGKIPVVGWGNTLASAQAVQQGYIKTALWQYPDSQGYLPITLLKMINDGFLEGFDIETLKFYDKTTVGEFMKFLH
jgi:simple sugar transport system substrate-binding protein